jgi:general stress protein 26
MEDAMTDKTEIETKFWKAVRDDKTMMVGLLGVENGHSQPMTAQFDGDEGDGPIWFFTSKDTDFAKALGTAHRGVAHFASKGHDLFASLDGDLTADNDLRMIERLWNPYVAAWFKGGKGDPKLQLVCFVPRNGQAWLNEHSLFAGVKMMMGGDPRPAINASPVLSLLPRPPILPA